MSSEWRPMSEAPKNGTWILWAMPGGRYCVIRWPEFEECWHDGHGVWQPLPEMPPAGDARERLEKVLAKLYELGYLKHDDEAEA